MRRRDALALAFALGAAAAGAFAGCRCQGDQADLGKLPTAIPVASSAVAAVLNPFGAPPYAGPVGTVVGSLRVDGDPPPELGGRAPPFNCPEAALVHRHAFRKGPAGELADAIVGVTGYKGYLLPRAEAVRATVRGCAFSARTYTLTFGQRLEIANADPRQRYLPRLEGAPLIAQMFAMPGGDPVKLYPLQPGRYALVDDLDHPWLRADVYVLKYPAHAVSAPDGAFRVENVPAGKVTVHAGHPAIGEGVSREIELKAGETLKVDLTLTYRAAAAPPAPGSAPLPAPGSAAPPLR